ncbi:hypothetical protein HLB44_02295 [Aquincola sp. S2]|uniref:Solute-binding protein family 3/N-terminal domain-containing protein n=1 Tax=Pseudaquabacterium terrae TaxID=2732868 RepID=A0ABX2E9W4_9BURK|nr:hypothetical protein [Aquabacterium terrae]NRF65809.1 hypothetical protein [Aquabacterium terrae]
MLPLMAASPREAWTAAPAPFVMGTTRPEDTAAGQWVRKIYGEAFRRLGIPVRFEVHPVMRLGVLLSQGELDGETVRGPDYASGLADVIRVDEPVWNAVFALYATHPALTLARLQDLPATRWRGVYARGAVECERTLIPLLAADRLIDVQITEQAVSMVATGRADFLCGFDLVVLSAPPAAPEARATAPLRKLINVGDPVPLYLHVNRKHAELAPRLAATLRQMKAERLIERYWHEALQAFGK